MRVNSAVKKSAARTTLRDNHLGLTTAKTNSTPVHVAPSESSLGHALQGILALLPSTLLPAQAKPLLITLLHYMHNSTKTVRYSTPTTAQLGPLCRAYRQWQPHVHTLIDVLGSSQSGGYYWGKVMGQVQGWVSALVAFLDEGDSIGGIVEAWLLFLEAAACAEQDRERLLTLLLYGNQIQRLLLGCCLEQPQAYQPRFLHPTLDRLPQMPPCHTLTLCILDILLLCHSDSAWQQSKTANLCISYLNSHCTPILCDRLLELLAVTQGCGEVHEWLCGYVLENVRAQCRRGMAAGELRVLVTATVRHMGAREGYMGVLVAEVLRHGHEGVQVLRGECSPQLASLLLEYLLHAQPPSSTPRVLVQLCPTLVQACMCLCPDSPRHLISLLLLVQHQALTRLYFSFGQQEVRALRQQFCLQMVVAYADQWQGLCGRDCERVLEWAMGKLRGSGRVLEGRLLAWRLGKAGDQAQQEQQVGENRGVQGFTHAAEMMEMVGMIKEWLMIGRHAEWSSASCAISELTGQAIARALVENPNPAQQSQLLDLIFLSICTNSCPPPPAYFLFLAECLCSQSGVAVHVASLGLLRYLPWMPLPLRDNISRAQLWSVPPHCNVRLGLLLLGWLEKEPSVDQYEASMDLQLDAQVNHQTSQHADVLTQLLKIVDGLSTAKLLSQQSQECQGQRWPQFVLGVSVRVGIRLCRLVTDRLRVEQQALRGSGLAQKMHKLQQQGQGIIRDIQIEEDIQAEQNNRVGTMQDIVQNICSWAISQHNTRPTRVIRKIKPLGPPL